MDKEILNMTNDELRIEVAMLRERCAQLEIRLEKANQFPPRWILERPRPSAPNTPFVPWEPPWIPDAPVWTGTKTTGDASPNPTTTTGKAEGKPNV
jgi:hypothetical protein